MAAPDKNQNAAKPEDQKATSFLYIRCKPSDKAAWVRASKRDLRGLSDWTIETLNAAARIRKLP